eukprot:COSAG04_NODE_8260_length_1000_cov_1.344062_2_plen_260_part_01
MSAMIYSSAHHAQTVDRFKERLRNGSAVDVLDDNGRWRRARVTQIDTDWGKCKVKFDGVSATQEEWVALSRDRVRQPGEMTHAQHAVEAHSAAFSAHASAASELRKEAAVLWLFAAVLLAAGTLWSDGAKSYALLAAAGATAWFGALPRTLRSIGEMWKADLSHGSIALTPGSSAYSLQQWQFWWNLRKGARVDFFNRSGQWVRATILEMPFPWRQVRVKFDVAASKSTAEWVALSEQRLLPAGQVTAVQESTHRNNTLQ